MITLSKCICRLCNKEFNVQSCFAKRGEGIFCSNACSSESQRRQGEVLFRERGRSEYDYSQAIYVNSKTKVKIVCYLHGAFLQTPESHMAGRGCPKCGAAKQGRRGPRLTTEDYITRAIATHGMRYCYDLSVYKGMTSKVKVCCEQHGSFLIQAHSHLQGSGCAKCANQATGDRFRSSKDEFIDRAMQVHGDRYDYSNVRYQSALISVDIECPLHGLFPQRPCSHLRGSGCPRCSGRISDLETEWLNSLELPDLKRQVCWVVSGRRVFVDGYNPHTQTVYEFYGDYYHGNPHVFDPHEMNEVCGLPFSELYNRTLERERLIRNLGYNVHSIWEADWIKNQPVEGRHVTN
jgi:hypothetical protein